MRDSYRPYTAADALTIGNASCGTIAGFLCLDDLATGSSRYLWVAFTLLPLALVCECSTASLRVLKKAGSQWLGGDLDSLADVISFRVAPAARAL